MIAPPALVAFESTLAGHPVAVQCLRNQSFDPGEGGYTLWHQDVETYSDGTIVDSPVVFDQVVYLPTASCTRLVVLLSGRAPALARRVYGTIVSPGNPDGLDEQLLADGRALHDALHEALHLGENSNDEARVECDTELNRWQAVKLLHVAAERTRLLLASMTLRHRDSQRGPVDYLADC
jgi:hypothetical protein